MSTTAKAKTSNIFRGGIIIDLAYKYSNMYDQSLFVNEHGEYLRKYKVLDIFDGVCDGWDTSRTQIIKITCKYVKLERVGNPADNFSMDMRVLTHRNNHFYVYVG